jgi:chromate reductase, NAD(P)H dehydrogenase (quinone)
VPGVLKNAAEWFSRPFRDSVLLGKPVAFLGASSGYAGTLRAQVAWRTSWYFHKAPVFSEVEFTLPFSAQHFDEDGHLIGDPSPQLLDSYVASFVGWVRRQSAETAR